MLPTDPPFVSPIETLETTRLSIRIDTENSYVDAFKTYSDDELKIHFGITTDEALKVQKGKVEGGLTTYRTSVVFFHLIERSLNSVIGNFAFHNWYPAHQRSEIGYAMTAVEYKNQGYMREALVPIIAYGYEIMNLNRMEAFIHPDNTASRKLVEGAGFEYEGLLRERYCDDGIMSDALVYALLRKNYVNIIGPSL